MAKINPVNLDLLGVLKRKLSHLPEALGEISDSLGFEEYDDLSDVESYPILGFYLLLMQEAFTLFTVSPGSFNVYERNIKGDSLSTSYPLERVQKVVLQSTANAEGIVEVGAIVEVDSGVREINVRGESVIEPRIMDGRVVPDQKYAALAFQGADSPAKYIILASNDIDDPDPDRLKSFIRSLRNALSY